MTNMVDFLSCPAGRVVFDPQDGGLPSRFELNDGTIPFQGGCEQLTLELEDGSICHPSTQGRKPLHFHTGDADTLEFADLLWRDGKTGRIIPDFHLGMRYELFSNGAFFATAVFHGENAEPPAIRSFRLQQAMQCRDFSRVRGQVVTRKGKFQAADMQSDTTRVNFEIGEDHLWKNNLLPQVRYYGFREHGPSFYGEFFLESGATLSGKPEDGSTSICWKDGNPLITWEFQNCPASSGHRSWQWRNRWGWILTPPPTHRNHAPQIMYHFIDNYRHYPDEAELEEIISSGCTLFIIHSNWRRDAVNDGIPYDPDRFHAIVRRLHECGIRVAVYCRGNEKEIVESGAEFFDRYLVKDFDGLYIDYGGPLCRDEAPGEFACCGSILFYAYHATFRRLRKRVGEKGFLLVHTGADFSNLIMGFVDGYVSGEAERGKLIQSREEHEFHTRAGAAVGTLWSAAFPEYTTLPMIPMIASAGQSPHSALGVQFKSSSLSHPPVPGINDTVFRPLWRIWSCFAGEEDVLVFNDYNSAGIFSDAGFGHYLMVSSDRKRALLVVADFGKVGVASFQVDWAKTGFSPEGKNCFRFRPSITEPGNAEPWCADELRPEFREYPAVGFYWGEINPAIRSFSKPYPPPGPSSKRYLQQMAEQRKLRETLCGQELDFRVFCDNSICTMLESSNYFDLWDNRFYLMERQDDGTLHQLGEIGRKGLYPEGDILEEERLRPGESSAKIRLAELLSPGIHRLAVQSRHFGQPFYSLITLIFQCGTAAESPMEFYNDLEPDRSCITWQCRILPAKEGGLGK